MTFQDWFNSAPHRAKYTNDHPAYLAAQEAWDAAHEACAAICDRFQARDVGMQPAECAGAIRARSQA